MRFQLDYNEDGTFTPESLEKVRTVVEEVMDGSSTLMDALGLKAEQFEALYAVAYNTYMAGKYEEAAKLFGVLVAIQPYDARIFMGLGASFQMLHNYENAAMFYQWACGIDQQDPAPMLHSAECFLAMKDVPAARSALNYTLKRADGKDAYAALCGKAEVMLANLGQ